MTKSTAASLLLNLGLLVTVSHTVRASDPDLTTESESAPSLRRTSHSRGSETFKLAIAVQFEFGPQSQISPRTHHRSPCKGNLLRAFESHRRGICRYQQRLVRGYIAGRRSVCAS
ncbi:unnamed protein product [Calypogeia fissa]